VFLIHQISRLGDTFWTFPKGHAEEGELPQESALRELKEETGLVATLDTTKTPYAYTYTFKDGEHTVEKTATYFVGWVSEDTSILQTKEVQEGRWCRYSEALTLLSHEPTRNILEKLYIEGMVAK
jgi:bis(5'-nucleosidyl)-tetraphosphatase